MGMPEEIESSEDQKTVHPMQMIKAEAGSTVSNISQTAINDSVINGSVNNAGRDVIYITLQSEDVKTAAGLDDVTVACAHFEAYLKTGPKKGISNDHEKKCYVEPTLLWQQDIERYAFLRDPDARESWLDMSKRSLAVSLSDLMRHERILLLGEFHTGKTRLIEHLCQTILHQRETQPAQSAQVVPIPLFVPLRYYCNPDESFFMYIQQSLYETYGPSSESVAYGTMFSDDVLRVGRYLFLLDGLDELGGPKRRELLRQIRAFISQYPQHSYLLSSRRSAYGAAETLFTRCGFALLTVTPFSAYQVQRYLEKRHRMDTPLADALRQRRDLLALARIPGLLKLFCDLWGEAKDIPQRLSALYEKLIHELLTKEIERDTVVIPHLGLTQRILGMLALEMTHRQVLSLPEEELEDLMQHLIMENHLSGSYSTREWIEEIRHREILVADGYGISFQHRSWQEYLTAYILKERSLDDVLGLTYVRRESESGFNPWWYQVLRFLTEMRPDILEALYEREEIVGARCTPLDAEGNARQRAFETILTAAAIQKMGIGRSPFQSSRDFFDDRQTCIDLNSPDAVAYLKERYHASSVAPVIRDDTFGLLIDYAANDNNEAMETVLELIPGLLSAYEEDWGLRETAAYAVSRLDLQEHIPQLLSLFESEENEYVRRAIIWSLATLAPRQARYIFTRQMIQRLGTRLPHWASEQALTVALPQLLDDQFIDEIRNWLFHIAHDIVTLPENLGELLVNHGTNASRELLLVMATHFLVAPTLSQGTRLTLYKALSRHPAYSIQYLFDRASETWASPRDVVCTLASLIDVSTLDTCRDTLTSSSIPEWLMNMTYQVLGDTGKMDIAKQLASYRGDILTFMEPEQMTISPTRETLGELLAQPEWQIGKAFGSHAEYSISEVDTLSSEQRKQLQEYIVEQLSNTDFAQAFRLFNERQGTYSPYLLICLRYVAALHINVTLDLYRKLLSIDFEDSSILTVCEQSYARERNSAIIEWIRADVPHACLLRAAELCGRHKIEPRKVVSALGEVIKALRLQKQKDEAYNLNIVFRLIQFLCQYGNRGARKIESLIGTVDDDCSLLLAKGRLALSPPHVTAEIFFLEYLMKRARTGDVSIWDQEMQYIQTHQAIPLLFDILRTLIILRGSSKRSLAGRQNENVLLVGVMPTEMKTSLLLTSVLSTLTRMSSDEVLQRYKNLMYEFPNESWLTLYYEHARKEYLSM